MEYGPRPDMNEEEGIGLDNGAEKKRDVGIGETIESIKNECAHVYDEPENGEKLDELISKAEEYYEVDPKGWQELMTTTKKKLVGAEDDTLAVENILKEALSTASAELI